MRNELREHFVTEISRKQFLQYLAGALLMVLGLNNLLSLLSNGTKVIEKHTFLPAPDDGRSGFGSRRFGV